MFTGKVRPKMRMRWTHKYTERFSIQIFVFEQKKREAKKKMKMEMIKEDE